MTAGVREPIVVILLLFAVFTAISGRPVNGLLLAVVAVCLAWDNARTPAVAMRPRAMIQRGGDEPSKVRSPPQLSARREA